MDSLGFNSSFKYILMVFPQLHYYDWSIILLQYRSHTFYVFTLLRFHAMYADFAKLCAYDTVCATEVDVPRARYRHTAAREEWLILESSYYLRYFIFWYL